MRRPLSLKKKKFKAEKLIDDRFAVSARSFAELVVWQVPQPLRGSSHHFKYRLAYVVDEVCVLRYDNEDGKGDHRHIRGMEAPYIFTDLDKLQADFWRDIDEWRP